MPSPLEEARANVARTLQSRIRGEVRFDPTSRALYATDASIHEIEPVGVVIPLDEEDAHAAVEACVGQGVAILARGGGTSLAGQAVGEAVVVDFSKHLNRVLEINAEEQWVRVQPGVVLDVLNRELMPTGLMFGPDVAPSNRATLGGMIGNNSSGTRSIVYGKTVDHVLELRVIMADGSRRVLEPGWDSLGPLAAPVRELVRANADEIRARFPKIMRRVSGYNLDALLDEAPNTAHIVVGSEGTLAVVEEARLRLVPRPRRTALLLVQFRDTDEALQANEEALRHAPSAVELLDRYLLEMAQRSIEYRRYLWFVDADASDTLIVEFSGDDDVEGRARAFEGVLRKKGLGRNYHVTVEEARKADAWKVRKAGLPLLLGMPGDRKPVAFVEDTAVAPERLAEFVRRFRDVVRAHGTEASYYAHASVGCLHIRPLLNLKDTREVRAMRDMAEEVFALVQEFGGSMSGEHGDGLSRSMFNERLFGPVVYQAFRRLKGILDPRGLLNPGKIVDAPDLTDHLRYGEGYPAVEIVPNLDFGREGGFQRAVELCNGAGVCRKTTTGTMCPSYMVTMDEEHSTRGRANALRSVLSGRLPREALTSKRMHEVMDLCIECKACKSECPSAVDMAKLKFEFLAQYWCDHHVPLRTRLFAEAARVGAWGTALAPVANRLLASSTVRWGLDVALGIDARRKLPSFAATRFSQEVASTRPELLLRWDTRETTELPAAGVVLLPDTFVEYHYPSVGLAAVRVLEALGKPTYVIPPVCCGRSLISKGFAHAAWEHARMLMETLTLLAERGFDIVVCEPSCAMAIRDDYRSLLPEEMVDRVAARLFLVEEYVARHAVDGMFAPLDGKALLHVHCQQKALVGTDAALAALRLVPGLEVEVVDSGCCGMAGAFGYEKEHYDLSMAMAERRLLPAVRGRGDAEWVVATGTSCRQQIRDGADVRALHPAQLLARALRPPDGVEGAAGPRRAAGEE